MLEALIILLLVLWLLGLVANIAGNFIHFLLITALVIFVVRWLTVRRAI